MQRTGTDTDTDAGTGTDTGTDAGTGTDTDTDTGTDAPKDLGRALSRRIDASVCDHSCASCFATIPCRRR